MSKPIWIKMKHGPDSKYFTLYTKDKEIARKYLMLPKKHGQFFYLNRSAKVIKKYIFGYGPEKDNRRYAYVRMMRSYPPVAEIMLRHEKTSKELRDQMEKDMGWDNVKKTWNGYEEWLQKREEQKYQKWVAKCKARGMDVENTSGTSKQ